MIVETLRLEESRFRRTLDRGLRILEDETARLGTGDRLAGDVAFKLYDTYGFPLDLTQDALKPRGVGVDMEGFNTAMERQRAEARRAWAGSGEAATEAVWYDVREKVGATEFLGYETETAEGVIRAIIAADGKETASLAQGAEAAVIVNQTPFYGESGGQVGDQGAIRTADGAHFKVRDTQKRLGDLYVHIGVLEHGVLHVGDEVELAVDQTRRQSIRIHHSATHLLHEALRQVLGPHVAPASRTFAISCSWRERSKIITVKSEISHFLALAIFCRFFFGVLSKSIIPSGKPAPTAIFSM
jgi:alanyl-tRNA synthetase